MPKVTLPSDAAEQIVERLEAALEIYSRARRRRSYSKSRTRYRNGARTSRASSPRGCAD